MYSSVYKVCSNSIIIILTLSLLNSSVLNIKRALNFNAVPPPPLKFPLLSFFNNLDHLKSNSHAIKGLFISQCNKSIIDQ